VDAIDQLLLQAAKRARQSGSESGGQSKQDESGDPSEGQPKGEKKDQEGKKDPLQDNKPGGDAPPDRGEKSPTKPKGPVPPPTSEKRQPTPKDLQGIFLARLPDKVREAVLAGDFDQVPEKYRDLIREWTTQIAEKDRQESEKK
jgi:hypothetical protein